MVENRAELKRAGSEAGAPLFFLGIGTELFFQLGDAFQQVWQILQCDHLPFGLPIRLGGRTEVLFAVADIGHDAGLCCDGDAIANFQVARYAGLPG